MDDSSGFQTVLAISKRKGPKQAEAVKVLGTFRTIESVAPLISALENPDRNVRTHAFRGLQVTLGTLLPYRKIDLKTTGYAPDAKPRARAEGLRQVRAFWEARLAEFNR